MRVTLHFFRHMRHFFQRGRNQSRQADDVGILCLGFGQNLRARHHHAHVHNFEVIALQDDRHDVLTDVMHITLHRRNNDLALGLGGYAGTLFFCQLFFLDIGHQMCDSLLHHTR